MLRCRGGERKSVMVGNADHAVLRQRTQIKVAIVSISTEQ
jgi:hypothetical protein